MMLILVAMVFMAIKVSFTACPPSLASRFALAAMPSVTLAFSVFCAMEADICSTLALVSSTDAACSVLAWLMLWAVTEISSEALARPSDALRTSLMICDSRWFMPSMARSRAAVSSRPSASMRWVRSPAARRSAISTAARRGRVMLRLIRMPSRMPKATPTEMIPISITRLCS